jgi:hypothetical protein
MQELFDQVQQVAAKQSDLKVPDVPFPFNILPVVVPILMGLIFVFFILMFIPKFRAKLLGLQIKTMKHMVKDNKDDLTQIGSDLGGISANIAKNVVDNNEETLRHTATKSARINEEGIEVTAAAVKRGFTDNNSKNSSNKKCASCGASADSDAIFCVNCGKKV